MDFNQRILKAYPTNIPLPYYMAYAGYEGAEDAGKLMKDLDYLQQTYPTEVRKYQKKVSDMVDRLDYEGSMIYDEYPDRLALQRLAESISKMCDDEIKQMSDHNVAQILLCDEIYRRRQKMRKTRYWYF